jgi:hypothetical protein
MMLLSPRLLVAVASSYVGDGVESKHRRGRLVDRLLRQVGGDPDADWSTAFVHHVGFWSHFDHYDATSCWPLPAIGACAELAEYSAQHDALIEDVPAHGDIFLLASPARNCFVRAGIIARVSHRAVALTTGEPHFLCRVVEGNSDANGMLGGGEIVQRERCIDFSKGDKLIRWQWLAPRATVVDLDVDVRKAA